MYITELYMVYYLKKSNLGRVLLTFSDYITTGSFTTYGFSYSVSEN